MKMSFAELDHWLQGLEFVVYLSVCVVLVFYLIPAYRRWRTRALLLLVMANLLDLFLLVFDNSIIKHAPTDPDDWTIFWLCREVVWVAINVTVVAGMLMFLRDYSRLAAAGGAKDALQPAAQPPDATS